VKYFSIKNTIGIIFIYFLSSVFLSFLYALLPIESKVLDNIVLSFISIITLLLVLYLSRKNLKGQFNDFFKNFKEYFFIMMKYWIIGFFFMIIANYVINFLILDGISPNESANREIIRMYPFYSLLSMGLIGPFSEEVLFRLNFKVIKERVLYLSLSSVSFGLMHILFSFTEISDILYIVPYTILGLSFGTIFYKTQNVIASTFAHIVHNTLSIMIILLGI